MKKLIITAAVAIAAIATNAATVQWNTTATKTPDTAQNITAARVNTYLFVINEPLTDNLWDTYTTKTGEGAATLWTVKDGAAAKNNDGVVYASGVAKIQDPNTYAEGKTAYGVIVMTRDAAGDGLGVGDWYMVAQVSQYMESGSIDYTPDVPAIATGNWVKLTAPGPDPIPEPTSGLLLLLGVAGLALRRKQK